jgi:bifunctional non-homologous end joining protein LigD
MRSSSTLLTSSQWTATTCVPLPLSLRKASLAKLLHRRPNGIFTDSFEQREIGPDLFRHGCMMGLEGLVSKRADRSYRSGRSRDWVKVKTSTQPNDGADR